MSFFQKISTDINENQKYKNDLVIENSKALSVTAAVFIIFAPLMIALEGIFYLNDSNSFIGKLKIII